MVFQRKSSVVKLARLILLQYLALIIVVFQMAVIGAQAQESEPSASLKKRMSGFWEAMQKEDYAAASQFVHPGSRDYFAYKAPRSRFNGWAIDKLEFNADNTACKTTTLIKKPIPFFGKEMDWPLQHDWVLFEGAWYLNLSAIADKTASNTFFKNLAASEAQASLLSQKKTTEKDPAAAEKHSASDPINREYARRLQPDPGNPTEMLFGEKAVFRFNYRNNTEFPYRIVSAHADCHCTAVSNNFPEVPPGQSATLEITLDSFGLPLGMIEKEVRVEFSDLQDPIPLQIQVPHRPNFTIEPRMVDLGQLEMGALSVKTFRITNESRKKVQFFLYPPSESRLELQLEKSVLEPKESMSVTLRLTPDTPGDLLSGITMRTDLAAEPLISVRIKAKVNPR
jgi:hypothetical protein